MRHSRLSFSALSAIIALTVVTSASSQASQPSPREILAEKIKTQSYKYANDPANYSLVQTVEKDAWKMIQMSEGFSSCSLPTYDLVQRMEGFNATYIQMKSVMDALPSNIPDHIRQQSVAQTESALNGQKAAIGKVLQNVLKYCK